MQIYRLTPALEILADGPQYVLSNDLSGTVHSLFFSHQTKDKQYYYVSAAEWGHRAFLLECLYDYNVGAVLLYQVDRLDDA